MGVTPWNAPHASGPIFSSVRLPGSKSLSARELLLAAIADTEGELKGVLRARDTDLMVGALTALGARFSPWPPVEEGAVRVRPIPGLWSGTDRVEDEVIEVECGLSGTVMRFIPVLALALGRTVRFRADDQANVRPMTALLQTLETLGGRWQSDDPARGLFPYTLWPPAGDIPAEIEIDARESSQFISALLLAAPLFSHPCTIRSKTEQVPSWPHIQMTLECLSKRGIDAQAHRDGAGKPFWTVQPDAVFGQDLYIEADLSNAGPFLAAVGIVGGVTSIPAWPRQSSQAGDAWRSILTNFGMTVTYSSGVLTVRGSGELRAIDRDFSQVGELVPTVAALAAYARGTSVLRNLHHLRGHETDRLEALRVELTRLGINVQITAQDDLVITGKPRVQRESTDFNQAVQMRSYADHRMATFAALMGLYRPVQLDDVACTAKTLPDFPALWTDFIKPVQEEPLEQT